MGSDSVTRKAFPMRKAKLRSVELPMKENKYVCKYVFSWCKNCAITHTHTIFLIPEKNSKPWEASWWEMHHVHHSKPLSWRIVSSTCSSLTWGLCRWLKMTASLKWSTPWTLVTLCRTCSHFCIAMQSVWTKGVRESKCVCVCVCLSVWEFVSVCVCKSVCVCECVHLRVCASAV